MRHRAKIKCQMPKAIDNDKSAIHFSKTKYLKKKNVNVKEKVKLQFRKQKLF